MAFKRPGSKILNGGQKYTAAAREIVLRDSSTIKLFPVSYYYSHYYVEGDLSSLYGI
jgi:hypothetical protein